MADVQHNPEEKPKKKGYLVSGWLLVIGSIAAIGAIAKNLNDTKKFWCDNIGFFCQSEDKWVKSGSVHVESGGTKDNKSDQCKDHSTIACVVPTNNKGRLVIESAKFDVGERSGAGFIDGKPINNDPIGTSNIGWFLVESSPDKICSKVYARTSACETKVYINGQLTAKESPR